MTSPFGLTRRAIVKAHNLLAFRQHLNFPSTQSKRFSPHMPFFQLAFYRTPGKGKPEPRDRMFYFLHFGYNHGRDCYELLFEKGRVVFSRVVTWHHLEELWITLMRVPPTEGYLCPHSKPRAS